MDKVIIFGAGDFGIKLYKKLNSKFDIIGFCDNNEQLWDKFILEKPVFAPNDLETQYYDKIVLGNNSFDSIDNILNQLNRIGIKKEKIVDTYVKREQIFNVADLFLGQHDLFNGYNKNGFKRYNLVILYLAIECMYKKNTFGIDICKKYRKLVMQEEGDRINEYIYGFFYLVESFEKDGYKKDSYISINKNGAIIDGTHRLALLIYHNIQFVNVRIINTKFDLEFGRDIDWLINKDEIFSKNDMKIIFKKYEEIKAKISNNITSNKKDFIQKEI